MHPPLVTLAAVRASDATMKAYVMLLGLALVFAAGTACFGIFSKSADRAGSARSCDGLDGQARRECEQQRNR